VVLASVVRAIGKTNSRAASIVQFARSGADAVADMLTRGIFESDSEIVEP